MQFRGLQRGCEVVDLFLGGGGPSDSNKAIGFLGHPSAVGASTCDHVGLMRSCCGRFLRGP